jgi:tripartite-type tricarboxylate transporter receptor subunit TctC
MMARTNLHFLALVAGLLLAASACAATTYPSKPIRFVVAFAPGGGTDVIARFIGRELADAWSTPVVIDNRPGAGSNIGARLVAKAPSDGYTVLVTSTAFAINPTLYKNAGYVPAQDFLPIINAGHSPTILVVHPSVAAKTLRELIALSKTQPLNYSSAGIGTVPFLTGEYLFNKKGGGAMVHIPHAGAGPALIAVVGGNVQASALAFATPSLGNWLSTGKLRAIVVTSAQRLVSQPEVPTASESGFPGYVDLTWIGFMAPANTTKGVVAKLNAEMGRILRLPAVKEQLDELGFEWAPNSPEDFARYVQSEVAKWASVIKETNAQVD